MWWHSGIHLKIPALDRWRQEDWEFRVILGYRGTSRLAWNPLSLCLKKPKPNRLSEGWTLQVLDTVQESYRERKIYVCGLPAKVFLFYPYELDIHPKMWMLINYRAALGSSHWINKSWHKWGLDDTTVEYVCAISQWTHIPGVQKSWPKQYGNHWVLLQLLVGTAIFQDGAS